MQDLMRTPLGKQFFSDIHTIAVSLKTIAKHITNKPETEVRFQDIKEQKVCLS